MRDASLARGDRGWEEDSLGLAPRFPLLAEGLVLSVECSQKTNFVLFVLIEVESELASVPKE